MRKQDIVFDFLVFLAAKAQGSLAAKGDNSDSAFRGKIVGGVGVIAHRGTAICIVVEQAVGRAKPR